jgi:hypothetical protein
MDDEKVYERYMGDGAYCYIYIRDGKFDVEETPMYGGSDQYLDTFDTLEEAKKNADNLC